jgi:hypothetical protein
LIGKFRSGEYSPLDGMILRNKMFPGLKIKIMRTDGTGLIMSPERVLRRQYQSSDVINPKTNNPPLVVVMRSSFFMEEL